MAERREYLGKGMTLFPVERVKFVVAWRNSLTGEHAMASWIGETETLWSPDRPRGMGPHHGLTEVWKPDSPGQTPPPGVFVISAFVQRGE